MDNLSEKERVALLLAKANLFTDTQDFTRAREIWSGLKITASDPEVKMQAFLGEGETLYNLGLYTESIAVYEEAKKIGADLPSPLLDKLHYGLAWALLKDGQFKAAITEFQKAVSFASDDIIKVASFCQMGDAYQDSQEYTKAIGIYERVLNDYPASPYADYVGYQLGLALLRSFKVEEAIFTFRKLLLDFADSKLRSQAVYSLALSLFKQQDYIGCNQAIKDNLADLSDVDIRAQSLYLSGTSLYRLDRFQEAIDEFKQVIREAKDINIIQKAEYEIADCLYKIGKEEEALQRFEALRAKYPDSTLSPEVTWWLGGYYFRKDNLELAYRYFTTLVRDFSESELIPDAYYALGMIEQEQKMFQQAINNYKKVIETAPTELATQAGIAMADILNALDRLNEAELAYKQALEKSPSLGGLVYPKIARIYEKRGKFDRAIEIYHKALALVSKPEEASSVQFKISRAYEQKGQLRQAIQEYLKIPDLYPQDSKMVVKAYLSTAQIYENQEDWSSARDMYSKVVSMEVQEAKYAKERLDWIDSQMKARLSERQ